MIIQSNCLIVSPPVMSAGAIICFFLFFVYFVVLCVCLCSFFSRDNNMISIGTVEFRYYVNIIIPVNLGKP